MSWLGYKASTSKNSSVDPREEKRLKLEKEQAERLRRAKERIARQQQLQAALEAQKEADQALRDFLNIDPEILTGASSADLTEEEVSELLKEEIMADFETENGTDGEKAMEKLTTVVCPFDQADIEYWFSEIEGQLELIEVKSQWLKRMALQRFLPLEIKAEIRSLLKLTKANAGTDIYKQMKKELIDLFGQKPEDAYKRAKSRVMTGKPSQLGKQLIEDLCKCDVKLSGNCCPIVIWGMFREALPVVIRNHIADMSFNKDTYKEIFARCDKIYDSNQDQPVRGASVASVTSTPTNSGEAVVAAVNKPPRRNKGNQGSNGSGSSGSNKPSSPAPKPAKAENKGTRHATAKGDSDKLCKMHFKWGENSLYCAAPWKCPMKNIFKAPQ